MSRNVGKLLLGSQSETVGVLLEGPSQLTNPSPNESVVGFGVQFNATSPAALSVTVMTSTAVNTGVYPNLQTTTSGNGKGCVIQVLSVSNVITQVISQFRGNFYVVGDTVTVAMADLPGSANDLVLEVGNSDLFKFQRTLQLPKQVAAMGKTGPTGTTYVQELGDPLSGRCLGGNGQGELSFGNNKVRDYTGQTFNSNATAASTILATAANMNATAVCAETRKLITFTGTEPTANSCLTMYCPLSAGGDVHSNVGINCVFRDTTDGAYPAETGPNTAYIRRSNSRHRYFRRFVNGYYLWEEFWMGTNTTLSQRRNAVGSSKSRTASTITNIGANGAFSTNDKMFRLAWDSTDPAAFPSNSFRINIEVPVNAGGSGLNWKIRFRSNTSGSVPVQEIYIDTDDITPLNCIGYRDAAVAAINGTAHVAVKPSGGSKGDAWVGITGILAEAGSLSDVSDAYLKGTCLRLTDNGDNVVLSKQGAGSVPDTEKNDLVDGRESMLYRSMIGITSAGASTATNLLDQAAAITSSLDGTTTTGVILVTTNSTGGVVDLRMDHTAGILTGYQIGETISVTAIGGVAPSITPVLTVTGFVNSPTVCTVVNSVGASKTPTFDLRVNTDSYGRLQAFAFDDGTTTSGFADEDVITVTKVGGRPQRSRESFSLSVTGGNFLTFTLSARDFDAFSDYETSINPTQATITLILTPSSDTRGNANWLRGEHTVTFSSLGLLQVRTSTEPPASWLSMAFPVGFLTWGDVFEPLLTPMVITLKRVDLYPPTRGVIGLGCDTEGSEGNREINVFAEYPGTQSNDIVVCESFSKQIVIRNGEIGVMVVQAAGSSTKVSGTFAATPLSYTSDLGAVNNYANTTGGMVTTGASGEVLSFTVTASTGFNAGDIINIGTIDGVAMSSPCAITVSSVKGRIGNGQLGYEDTGAWAGTLSGVGAGTYFAVPATPTGGSGMFARFDSVVVDGAGNITSAVAATGFGFAVLDAVVISGSSLSGGGSATFTFGSANIEAIGSVTPNADGDGTGGVNRCVGPTAEFAVEWNQFVRAGEVVTIGRPGQFDAPLPQSIARLFTGTTWIDFTTSFAYSTVPAFDGTGTVSSIEPIGGSGTGAEFDLTLDVSSELTALSQVSTSAYGYLVGDVLTFRAVDIAALAGGSGTVGSFSITIVNDMYLKVDDRVVAGSPYTSNTNQEGQLTVQTYQNTIANNQSENDSGVYVFGVAQNFALGAGLYEQNPGFIRRGPRRVRVALPGALTTAWGVPDNPASTLWYSRMGSILEAAEQSGNYSGHVSISSYAFGSNQSLVGYSMSGLSGDFSALGPNSNGSRSFPVLMKISPYFEAF